MCIYQWLRRSSIFNKFDEAINFNVLNLNCEEHANFIIFAGIMKSLL